MTLHPQCQEFAAAAAVVPRLSTLSAQDGFFDTGTEAIRLVGSEVGEALGTSAPA